MDLPVDLGRGAEGEEYLQITDILAISGGVDGQEVISDYHWVHIVLFGQEIQTENIVLRRLHRITKAGQWDLDQAH